MVHHGILRALLVAIVPFATHEADEAPVRVAETALQQVVDPDGLIEIRVVARRPMSPGKRQDHERMAVGFLHVVGN